MKGVGSIVAGDGAGAPSPRHPERSPGAARAAGREGRSERDSSGESTQHERRRAEIVAEIPAAYRPGLHLAGPSLVGLAVLVAAARLLHDVRAGELVTIPLTLLFAFGFEWRVHKDVLHRSVPGLRILYVRHEITHHTIFTHEDMALRSGRELYNILMPGYAIVLVFLVALLPAAVLAELFGLNVAALFVTTAMVFFLLYEWMHCAYHLPPESWIGRLRPIAALRAHHAWHHDPRLMKRWNFNVTVPVFDWIHGTAWSPEREAARKAAAARKAEHGASRA
jgi:hypothetical protein